MILDNMKLLLHLIQTFQSYPSHSLWKLYISYKLFSINILVIFWNLNFISLYHAIWLRAELVLVERIEYNDLVGSIQESIDSSDSHNDELSNGNSDAETNPGNCFIIRMLNSTFLSS